jgi:Leucine-rich repeat (LRR) protein
MGDEEIQSLVNSSLLKQLEELEVAGNSISGSGIRILANSIVLPRLKKLDLRRNRLNDTEQIFLADSPKFGHLDQLRF